jgi:hypothetical protein
MAPEINFVLAIESRVVYNHRGGSWLMAAMRAGGIKAAAAATGGGMAASCAASMAGWWFDCSWCIANEVDDHLRSPRLFMVDVC